MEQRRHLVVGDAVRGVAAPGRPSSGVEGAAVTLALDEGHGPTLPAPLLTESSMARSRVPADLPRLLRCSPPSAADGGGAHRARRQRVRGPCAAAGAGALSRALAPRFHQLRRHLEGRGARASTSAKQIEGKDDSSKQLRDSLYIWHGRTARPRCV